MAEERRSKKPRIEYELKNESHTGYDWRRDPLYDSLLVGDEIKPFICETMRKGDILIKLVDTWMDNEKKDIEADGKTLVKGDLSAYNFVESLYQYVTNGSVKFTVGQFKALVKEYVDTNGSDYRVNEYYNDYLISKRQNGIIRFDDTNTPIIDIIISSRNKDYLYKISNILTKEQLCIIYTAEKYR